MAADDGRPCGPSDIAGAAGSRSPILNPAGPLLLFFPRAREASRAVPRGHKSSAGAARNEARVARHGMHHTSGLDVELMRAIPPPPPERLVRMTFWWYVIRLEMPLILDV